VLTGLAPVSDFRDPARGGEASVAYAIEHYMTGYGWLGKAVTVAILAGFSWGKKHGELELACGTRGHGRSCVHGARLG